MSETLFTETATVLSMSYNFVVTFFKDLQRTESSSSQWRGTTSLLSITHTPRAAHEAPVGGTDAGRGLRGVPLIPLMCLHISWSDINPQPPSFLPLQSITDVTLPSLTVSVTSSLAPDRLMEWFVLEEILKIIWFKLPWHDQGTFHWTSWLRASSSLLLSSIFPSCPFSKVTAWNQLLGKTFV